MAKPKDEKDRRTKRIMVSLTDTEKFQLMTLAKVAGKPAAVGRRWGSPRRCGMSSRRKPTRGK